MSSQIAIGGHVIELESEITYNLQIADVGDVSKSKSNYTSTFQIPRTIDNVAFFDGLGVPADFSDAPYSVMDAVCMNNYNVVYRGTLVILKTDSLYYHATVISGAFDFFTLLGDTRFSDIDITEIIHEKTQLTVSNRITTLRDDFNYFASIFAQSEDAQRWTDGINVDAMAPAVNLRYLLDKAFEFTGLEYTLPAGIELAMQDEYLTFPYPPFLEVGNDSNERMTARRQGGAGIVVPSTQTFDSPVAKGQYGSFDSVVGLGFYASAPLTINFETSGQFLIVFNRFVAFQHLLGDPASSPVRVRIRRNTVILGEFDSRLPTDPPEEAFRTTGNFNLFNTLQIEFIGQSQGTVQPTVIEIQDIDLRIYDTSITTEGVQRIFGLSIKTFVKEFMYRYALIPVQRPNGIDFISMGDILNAEPIDWSDKYMERTEESYDIGYAQNNWLKHRYAADGENYYDRNVQSRNQNLLGTKDIIQSEFYAPSKTKELLTIYDRGGVTQQVSSRQWHTYDVTKKEDSADIKTENRHFFVHLDRYPLNNQRIAIASSSLPGDLVYQTTHANVGEFRAAFNETPFWSFLSRLTSTPRVHNILLNLNIGDINGLDMTRPYYFEQEAAYYILNKVQYTNGQPARAEFVKIYG